MKYLYGNLKFPNGQLIIFLDYDGTLTPIVKRPKLARLDLSTKGLLERLSKKITLCIISGRSLKDIKSMVRIPHIVYAGNHGLEINYYGKKFVHPVVQRFRESLKKIIKFLKNNLEDIPGALIEDKGFTLSIHYRNVKNRHLGKIKTIIKAISGVKITKGKKVFEIRPKVDWDKGSCVKKIMDMAGKGFVPVYIGDDTTDEDAFRVIKDKGIGIYVGMPKKSNAGYYLKNTKEVTELLRRIYGTL